MQKELWNTSSIISAFADTQYTDGDITNSIEATIRSLWGFFARHHYLLQGPANGCFVSAVDARTYWVAITPAVDTVQLALPLDYFLDKTRQPLSALADILETLLPVIASFSKLENTEIERSLATYLKSYTQDAATVAVVLQELRAAKFNPDKLKERITLLQQETLRRDVFDEIMPHLKSVKQGQVKILFPYNLIQHHWLTGEIDLIKREGNYVITLMAHDPFGGGTVSKENIVCLQRAISKRIQEEDTTAQPIIFQALNSPYHTQRQASGDCTSCGIIVAYELIERIQEELLDREKPFSKQEIAILRQEQKVGEIKSLSCQMKGGISRDLTLSEPVPCSITTNLSINKDEKILKSDLPSSSLSKPVKVDDFPPQIGKKDSLLEMLRAYYCCKDTFQQGLSNRRESITKSFINVTLLTVEEQQEKEKGLNELKKQEDDQDKEAKLKKSLKANKIQILESYTRDERLASYEALHAVKESIALEAIFSQVASSADEDDPSSAHRVLVLGRAGIGKTILSQHIAYRWATNDLWPQYEYLFWLPLRNLNQPQYGANSELTLAHIIHQECFAGKAQAFLDAITALLASDCEKILLLLDGYDEVAHLADGETPLSSVLHQALAFTNILVTSRPYSAPLNIAFDRHLESMGFTNDNILEYIANYFTHPEVHRPEETNYVQSFLKANPNIWGTAHIPINLALICNAWEQALAEGKTLNVRLSMTGLYSNLVQALLKRYLARRAVPVYGRDSKWLDKQCREATNLLGALAARGMEENQLILGSDLQQAVLSDLKQNGEVYEDVLSLGLLQTVGNSQTELIKSSKYFIHLTFQEFFAARFYVRRLRMPTHSEQHQLAVNFLREYKYSPRYQIVFWFMAGLFSASAKERPLTIFWQTLVDEPHDLIGLLHFRLLMRCLDEAQCDPRIPRFASLLNYIGETFWSLIQSFDNFEFELDILNIFLNELKQCPYLSQQPFLANYLIKKIKKSKKEVVKEAVVKFLSTISCPPPEVIQFLKAKMLKDNSNRVSIAAVHALNNSLHLDLGVLDIFFRALQADINKEIKREIVYVLSAPSKLLQGRVIDFLCKRIQIEKNYEVREAIVETLSKVPDFNAVLPVLCRKANEDESEWVRRAAIRSLGKVSGRYTIVVRTFHERAQCDNERWVRMAAIEALSNLPNTTVEDINILKLRANKEKHAETRKVIINALGKYVNIYPSLIDILCDKIDMDSEEDIKILAETTLGNIIPCTPDVVDILCSRLGDKNKRIREAVILSLGKTRVCFTKVFNLIVQQAKCDRDYGVIVRCHSAISNISTPSSEIIDILCTAAQDKDVDIRQAALLALIKFPTHSPLVTDILCQSAQHIEQFKDDFWHTLVIKALSNIPDPDSVVIETLRTVRNKKRGHVQSRTQSNLSSASINDVNILCMRARSKMYSERLRHNSIIALGKIYPNFKTIEVLSDIALDDKQSLTRYAAIMSLNKMPKCKWDVEIAFVLSKTIEKDENQLIRKAAIRGLDDRSKLSSKVIDFICKRAIRGHTRWIRITSISNLGRLVNLAPNKIISALCQIAAQDEFEDVKRTARNILHKIEPRLLIQANSESIYKHHLAKYIVMSVLLHNYAICVTQGMIKLYDKQTSRSSFVSPNQGTEFAKKLIAACDRLVKETGLLAVTIKIDQPSTLFKECLENFKEDKAVYLSLRSKCREDHQVKQIARSLSDCPYLTALDLSNNTISNKGASYLADALQSNESITELNLQDNQLGVKGANAFIKILGGDVKNSNTTSRITSPNRIKFNQTLRILHLEHNPRISKEALSTLEPLMGRNEHWYQAGQQLLESTKLNKSKDAEQALREGALVTASTKKGERALHVAARFGCKEVANYLLNTGQFTIDMLNRQGMTAFYQACAYGQWEMACYLLSQGADVNAPDHQGRSALHHASEKKDIIVMRYLLEDARIKDKVLINLPDNEKRTPLHYAVMSNSEECTWILLANKANALAEDKKGDKPLDFALRGGNPTLIGYLQNTQPDSKILSPHSQTRWVKIRVWSEDLAECSLGHISLETKDFYASFWPNNYRLQDALKPVSASYVASPKEDKRLEGNRLAKKTILYSLDTSAIQRKYQEFLAAEQKWALTGRPKFLPGPNGQNCSGLVYDLLLAGGIRELVGKRGHPWRGIVTPERVGRLVRRARKAERQKYPAVRSYKPTRSLPTQKGSIITQEAYEATLKRLSLRLASLDQRLDTQEQLSQAQQETFRLEVDLKVRALENNLRTEVIRTELSLLGLQQSLMAQPSLTLSHLPVSSPIKGEERAIDMTPTSTEIQVPPELGARIRKIIGPLLEAAAKTSGSCDQTADNAEIARTVSVFYMRAQRGFWQPAATSIRSAVSTSQQRSLEDTLSRTEVGM